ncbi:MAG: hypothetical protein U0269_23265 [Polyangiales bacterium]
MTLFAPRGELASVTLGEKLAIDRGTTTLGALAVTFESVTPEAAHGHVELDGARIALSIPCDRALRRGRHVFTLR